MFARARADVTTSSQVTFRMTITRAAVLAAGFVLFAVLATANSGGYRYGISDQAYYGAAVLKSADPTLFPRDSPLLDAQSRFMFSDNLLGWIVRTTGLDLPTLFLIVYGVTLAALFAAAVFFARGLGASWWAVGFLLVMLTFRHRIAKTGANSLEGYMHTRMLAFAIGIVALGLVLRSRIAASIAAVAVAAVVHTTTALWFGLAVLIIGARGLTLFGAPGLQTRGGRTPGLKTRGSMIVGVAIAVAVAVLALGPGFFSTHLHQMDPEWLRVIGDKDYLFPAAWPAYAWLMNLAYSVIIVSIYRRRLARGLATTTERSLVVVAIALTAVFLAIVPFTMLRIALAVQLQANRVFWLLDFMTASYIAVWLVDDVLARRRRARLIAIAAVALLSAGRGYYVQHLQADRSLIQKTPPANDWTQTMAWLTTQPKDWHVLADPGHAWKYGVSLRLAAQRDTFLESGKDTALAMYDREIAMRVGERAAAVRDFDRLTRDEARGLARRYAIDVLVVETPHSIDLPVLFRNGGFTVYDLRTK
jgi:hypothetical protein